MKKEYIAPRITNVTLCQTSIICLSVNANLSTDECYVRNEWNLDEFDEDEEYDY